MIVGCDNKDTTHHGSNVVMAWFLYFVCYIFFKWKHGQNSLLRISNCETGQPL